MRDATLSGRGVISRLSAPGAIRVGLLLYGVVLALWSAHRLDASIPDKSTLMQSRQVELERAQRALATGGPPLYACLDDYDSENPLAGCYPAGTTDDQGIYLVLPLFAEAVGIDSPELAMKWLYITLFGLLAFVAPLIFHALFGSVLAGLFAGLAIVFRLDVFANTDVYWFSSWCYLLAVPLLLLVYKRWNGWLSVVALAGVVVIGSFATVVRIHAGLPILLGALIVAFLRRTTLLRLLPTALALFLAYLSFGFALDGVREYRDRTVGDPSLSDRYPTRHPFWHNVYIGLGYLPNPYGIEWDDSVAIKLVERRKPGAEYLSPEYERTLRDEFFHILGKDPAFVLDNLITKTGIAFDTARDRFGSVLLLAPFALFFGRNRREWKRYLVIAAPMFLISLPPPVLTMPLPQYQIGWLGAWATLWLLLACWAIVVLPGELRVRLDGASLEARPRTWTLRDATVGLVRWPGIWVAVASVAALVLVADVIGPRAERVADADFWRPAADALVAPTGGPTLHDWRFAGGLPEDWAPDSAAGTEPTPEGLKVVTNNGRFDYQLLSTIVRLPAGSYEVRARIEVLSGGVELGALDAGENAWLKTTHYWQGQRGNGTRDLSSPFTLSTPTDMRVILANWHARPRESTWIIRRVWIRRA